MCTALVVGNIVGVGIFVLPASIAPYGLNALTGWLITAVGCGFLAIAFAGLARAFPQDDGPYDYTRRAFGDGTAFAVMWCYWVSVWVSNATIAVGVVAYLTVFTPGLNGHPWLPPVVALSMLWLFVLLNLLGARAVGWVQVLTTVLKLLPLVGAICLGLWVLWRNPGAYREHIPPNPLSIGDVSAVSTLALYAMLGIECAMIPACRVYEPQKTIPRATFIGTVLTAVIFICVSTVPMLLIPQNLLAASNAPFADLFAQAFGARSGQLVALFVIISGLGALNGWTLMVGDVTQGLARHGHFPRFLARENRNGAPTAALWVTGLIASVMLLSNYSESIGSLFTFFIVVVTAACLPLYVVCSLAVIVLGRRGEKAFSGRARLAWVIVGTCGAAYCGWVSIGVGLRPLLWTVGLGAACAPIYWTSVHFRRRAPALPS